MSDDKRKSDLFTVLGVLSESMKAKFAFVDALGLVGFPLDELAFEFEDQLVMFKNSQSYHDSPKKFRDALEILDAQIAAIPKCDWEREEAMHSKHWLKVSELAADCLASR